MAYSRAVSRFCFRLQSLSPKFNTKSSVPLCTDSSSFIKSTSKAPLSSSSRRTSRFPLELSALITMMPLHSAIASSCLKSGLLIESQSWGLVPQDHIKNFFGNSYLVIMGPSDLEENNIALEEFQCLYDTSLWLLTPSRDLT